MKNFTFISYIFVCVFFQSCNSQEYEGLKMHMYNRSAIVLQGENIEINATFNREIKDSIHVNLESEELNLSNEIVGEEIKITAFSPEIGIKRINGNIQIVRGGNVLKEFKIDKEFIIIKPNAVIINVDGNKQLKLNQLNELNISVPGIPITNIELQTDNGSIIKKGIRYYLKPIIKGGCKLYIKGELTNGVKYDSFYEFEVK